MTLEQFMQKLQDSIISREVVFISDGNDCCIAEYDTNLNLIYL